MQERTAELDKSEHNLALALDTVNDTYEQVGKEWLSKNGDLTRVQRSILEKALKTYQAIVEQADERPASRVQAGQAYRRMADIQQVLRDFAAARACYARAVQVQSGLVAANPRDDAYRLRLSNTYNHLGILLRSDREWQEAEKIYDRCQRELTHVLAHDPQNLELRNSLLSCAINRAGAWFDQGQNAQAETLLLDARNAAQEFSSSDIVQSRTRWLTSSGLLASTVDEASRTFQTLVLIYPDTIRYAEGHAAALDQLALLQLRQQKISDSKRSAEFALEHWRKLSADSTDPELYNSDLAISLCRLCWLLAGPPETDMSNGQRAVELAQEAVKRLPQRANGWISLALAQYRCGRLTDAREALGRDMESSPPAQALSGLLMALIRQADGDLSQAQAAFDETTQQRVDSEAEETVWLALLRAEAAAKFAAASQPVRPAEP